jgi:thiol-disulfide isomerase/thioredoxin
VEALNAVGAIRLYLPSQNAIDTHKITVFSKSWCPFCKKTKALFAEEFKDEQPYIIECASSAWFRSI